jgi:hypothetical protein
MHQSKIGLYFTHLRTRFYLKYTSSFTLCNVKSIWSRLYNNVKNIPSNYKIEEILETAK